MCLIVCLHTAASNVAVFEAAVLAGGLEGVGLRHVVRADLLAAAELAGGLTPAIVAETGAALVGLCAGADAVLLTCSTLGPAAAVAAVGAAVPILRVDAPLADEVARDGGTVVVVLCAAGTTVAGGCGGDAAACASHSGANTFARNARAVPHMKPGASIINTTSVQAKVASKGMIVYSATKGALASLTIGLSNLLAPEGDPGELRGAGSGLDADPADREVFGDVGDAGAEDAAGPGWAAGRAGGGVCAAGGAGGELHVGGADPGDRRDADALTAVAGWAAPL